jgi:hypothetical protein
LARNTIHIELKDPKELVKCDACDRPRTVLISIGFNYIRVCDTCADLVQRKIKTAFKNDKEDPDYTNCPFCLEDVKKGKEKEHVCSI